MLTSTADLDSLIAQTGLTESASVLRARARHGFHIQSVGKATNAPLGGTRFGGLPDLPPDALWPSSPDGAWTFYAQIDLADIGRGSGLSCLPEKGLLSFFSGWVEGAADPIAARVVYIPAGSELTRRRAESFAEGCALLEPVSVRFSPVVSLPFDDLDFVAALEAASPRGDVEALTRAVLDRPEDTIGLLLAHAVTMQDDLHAAVAFDALGRSGQGNLIQWRDWPAWEAAKTMKLRMAGGGIYEPWSARDDDNVRWIIDNRAKVEAEIAAWALLLRVDSNRAMDLSINDADPIYFFAREDALARADFSGVRARATQS